MKRTSVCVNRLVDRRYRPVVLWHCVDGSLVKPEGRTDFPHYDFRESIVPGELRLLDWEYGTGDAGWAKDTESGMRLLLMVYSNDFNPFWKTADALAMAPPSPPGWRLNQEPVAPLLLVSAGICPKIVPKLSSVPKLTTAKSERDVTG